MITRSLASVLLVVAVSALALGVSARQSPSASGQGSAPAWEPPRTPDGQPNMQGTWTAFTDTPFEVFDPSDTPDIYNNDPSGSLATNPGTPNDTAGRKLTKGRSLVVDPPNGRVPILPWAEQRRNYRLAHIQDHWEHHTSWERCITRGVPGALFPGGYGNGYQIFQSPGYFTILYEMIHEARIIPLDGRPHIGRSIRTWNGDSRGRWEGNTLVVETTNLNATSRLDVVGDFFSDKARIVERFIFVDANTMTYEATITDPTVFTRSWTMRVAQRRMPDEEFWEWACHEGERDAGNSSSRIDSSSEKQ